ncbi:LOW QUALITY PROTEIN: hypothetical protein V1477_019279 [Vespula maculifrons]|uniref:Uncharacterized protein n=1 Tax=Vespula maculifrons TaxID=7453 RepID=A0ABD2AS26_VESMC
MTRILSDNEKKLDDLNLILFRDIELYNPDKFVRFDQSCQSCSGCPMRPCPPERSCPPKYICPPSSPHKICIIPPIPQKPSWKPCCIRVYGFPCNRHRRPEKFIRFTNLDCCSQFLLNKYIHLKNIIRTNPPKEMKINVESILMAMEMILRMFIIFTGRGLLLFLKFN